MSEPHSTEAHGPAVNMYWVIFAALSVFTVISFVVNGMVEPKGKMPKETGFLIILSVAVCKAVLVGLIFMHLKWDWGRLYFIIIPVMVLGTLLVVVLLPDIVLGWKMHDEDKEKEKKEPVAAWIR